MTTATEVLGELETLGSEQTRKIYRRHGADGDLYGVSFAHLGQFKKKLKLNDPLARDLWASGNYDARVLATMIADPIKLETDLLESWVNDLRNYALADALAGLVAHTPLARQKVEAWTQRASEEWVARAGWLVLAGVANDDQELPDSYFEPYLETIERQIHHSLNYVKDAMNTALIAIGSRNERLEEKAIEAAGRIGKVTVDHGETNCKTPDAAGYIRKTVAHRKARAEKKAAKV